MSSLVRADPVLGRHLFRADPHGAVQRWRRDAALGEALRDGFRAVAPWLRLEELAVTLGQIDEVGAAEAGDVVQVASVADWPAGAAVEASGDVGAVRIGLPPAARLGASVEFACDSGFRRAAAVEEAPSLGELGTAWIVGSSFMEARLRGRVDGSAWLEVQLGTSLHGAPDPRDPALVVEGAPLADWRAATRPVLAEIARALEAAGFRRE